MKAHPFNIEDSYELHIINLEELSDMKKDLDQNIKNIIFGVEDESDLNFAKQFLNEWFVKKSDDNRKKLGHCSEFFAHLYLNKLSYMPYFLFQNLEEPGSMKKGFDGIYKKDNVIWIYESKSTMYESKNKKHKINIQAAYKDIKAKVEGKNFNNNREPINPWHNAYNHARSAYVDPNDSILKNLRKYREDFMSEKYSTISHFNIIPCSTIYNKNESFESFRDTYMSLKSWKIESPKKLVLCFNSNIFNEFMEYLNGE